MKIKKGDTVMVIAGNDKGKTGEVKQVVREKGRVVIDGVNLRWKHKKPSQKNPKGERIQLEVAIHASNVMHLDPKTGKPTRKSPPRETKRETARETARSSKKK